MNAFPLATVVIPTCHRLNQLQLCLSSVQDALGKVDAGEIEVIVSDDSRDTLSRQFVETRFPWVRYVEGPRRGPAANRNCGVRHAHGRWLIFTDDDCVADPEWLAAYVKAFGQAADVEVFEGRTRADRARRSCSEESPVNENGGYLWSCNMAIGSELFRRMGGFCESFPYPAMEDVDLRLRLERGGQRAVFLPDAAVCHPFRPMREIGFIRQHNASYVHLLERHPDIWRSFTWRGIAANAARMTLVALKNALRYGLGGIGRVLYAALTKTLIDIRFKLSGWRSASATRH